jgi:TrmH family RNA methyltransferase
VREFRDLARPGQGAGRVLLDGDHLVVEALASGVPLDVVAAADGAMPAALAADLAAAKVRVVSVSPAVLGAMSPVREPSGMVAIARHGPSPIERVLATVPQLVLVADAVQDPGNVGAIVRAADACGGSGVVTTPGTADPFAWKSLRGSMGSAFRVPIATRIPLDEVVAAARAEGVRLLATVPRGGISLPRCDLRAPAIILLGGEGSGLGDAVRSQCDEPISIPMRPAVESMNVASVAAIVLYEAARQRAQ